MFTQEIDWDLKREQMENEKEERKTTEQEKMNRVVFIGSERGKRWNSKLASWQYPEIWDQAEYEADMGAINPEYRGLFVDAFTKGYLSRPQTIRE